MTNDPTRQWLLLGLQRKHGARWRIIANTDLGYWTADRTDGTEIRIVAAHTAAELSAKLDAIEEARDEQ